MTERVGIASFLARWSGCARFDLSGSDSETLPLSELLALAGPEDRVRWERLGFGYAELLGAPWLRHAIARRHRTLEADDIVCCAGAQEAISCVARAILSASDHAVVILPLYQPSEETVTSICSATGVPLRDPDWQLDIDRVAQAVRPNTRLVLANFPNSPTGAALDAARFDALVSLCRKHGLWLVNDEIYRQTDGHPGAEERPMVADVYERGISVNGLSKGFGLPGLRVGWAACGDPRLRARILWAKSQLSTCISSASEVLAHVALNAEAEIVSRTRAIGLRNRKRLQIVLERCRDVFEPDSPRNSAFGFPRYIGPGSTDDLAERLVRDAGILILPSTLWGSPLAAIPSDHVRISLGHAKSATGLDRLEQFLSGALQH